MDNKTERYDAIIVGTGPGGGIVARDLTKQGKTVLIIERGDYSPTRGTLAQMISRGWIPGTQMPVTTQFKPVVRGITTGGTSMLYTATAAQPPFELLEKYGVNIRTEIAELREELPIAPIRDELMSPAATLFMQSARELGYDCQKLDKFIYQDKCLRDCDNCIKGCPHEAKWNSRFLVDEALLNGATIINNAKVKRVITKDNRAVGVEYKRGIKAFTAKADTIVVAAGGIGSPLILRNSGFTGVGENVCMDPILAVFGRIKGLKGSGRAVPMMTGFHLKEEGIMIADLHVPKLLKQFFDLHALNVTKVREFADVIPIMVKVRDELSGKIHNDGLLKKDISPADKAKLNKGEKIAQAILKQAGAKKTYSSQIVGAHPGASVKIGEHVDENLKTHFDGLYVCDCSVYPEALGLPPSLMILGLGKRLAKHLASPSNRVMKKEPVGIAMLS